MSGKPDLENLDLNATDESLKKQLKKCKNYKDLIDVIEVFLH